jgi:hypothetical protein
MCLYGPLQGSAPCLDRLGELLCFGIGEPAGGVVGEDGFHDVVERREGRLTNTGHMLVNILNKQHQ